MGDLSQRDHPCATSSDRADYMENEFNTTHFCSTWFSFNDYLQMIFPQIPCPFLLLLLVRTGIG